MAPTCRAWNPCPGRDVKRNYDTRVMEGDRSGGPVRPEGVGMYDSRCSPPALMALLDEEGRAPDYFVWASNAPASRILEPFAFVVCNGFLASVTARKERTVRLHPGTVLPLTYGRAFEREPDDGD